MLIVSESKQAGFTLLEMTVVLAIAALVFALGAVSFSALKGRQSAWQVSEDIAQLVDTARLRVRQEQSVQSVIIDLEAKAVFLGSERRILVPGDYGISVIVGRETVADTKRPEIHFLPDGTSSGGEILISDPVGLRVRVDINWLTSLTRISNAIP